MMLLMMMLLIIKKKGETAPRQASLWHKKLKPQQSKNGIARRQSPWQGHKHSRALLA
jgi:hypothetical protein